MTGLLMDQDATGLAAHMERVLSHAAEKLAADRGSGARGHQTLFLEPDRTPVRATLPRGSGRASTAASHEPITILAMNINQQANQGTFVVFRIQLLPPSETFIVAQAAAMRRFSPFFVGWRRMAGIELPADASWTVDGGGLRGRLRELRFRYAGPTQRTGRAPAGAGSAPGLCALRSRWLRGHAACGTAWGAAGDRIARIRRDHERPGHRRPPGWAASICTDDRHCRKRAHCS